MVWLLYALSDPLAITPQGIDTLKGKVLLLDVRNESFREEAEVEADYVLPFWDILEGANPPEGYDFYITVCSCPRGGIARRAALILRERGFKAYYLWRNDG